MDVARGADLDVEEVKRERDARDARIVRVRTTNDGRSVAAQSVAIMDAVDSAFFAPVAPFGSMLRQLKVLGNRDARSSERPA